MTQPIPTKYLCEVTVKDIRGEDQVLEIHESPDGSIFGVDTTYLDQVGTIINSPYDATIKYDCSDNGIDESDKIPLDFLQ